MFHLYKYRQDEFLPHYHQRSNSESTFSAIKRLFGETLRNKNLAAQVNELLLKVIAYNITCMVHSIFELGVTCRESQPARKRRLLLGARDRRAATAVGCDAYWIPNSSRLE
jgi:hypothetical protein